MFEYINTGYTDMVLVYGKAAGNRKAARRIDQERYPHRVTPSYTLFAKVIHGSEKEEPSQSTGLIVILQGGITFSTLKMMLLFVI